MQERSASQAAKQVPYIDKYARTVGFPSSQTSALHLQICKNGRLPKQLNKCLTLTNIQERSASQAAKQVPYIDKYARTVGFPSSQTSALH
ncbi:hypothetical protein DPMN_177882 [Dreissena polymorpha]|uniref:Uncharacterized protein n=1 Tax=Dreissena polymorpha TaxID=45954 RepID=A0A9D4E9U1_DREPO|nr:hypothetical protein DPMN_177882 [Dreissena polymorpha]